MKQSAKIGLVQVDRKLPNLALMQISRFYEKRTYRVEWYLGGLFSNQYEKVYASKIFDFSIMPELPKGAVVGGTGVDWFNTLPLEMQNEAPSYTLYPDCDYHIGFSMKGCRFKCSF